MIETILQDITAAINDHRTHVKNVTLQRAHRIISGMMEIQTDMMNEATETIQDLKDKIQRQEEEITQLNQMVRGEK